MSLEVKIADTGEQALMDISANVNKLALGDSDDERFLDSFIVTISDLIYYINNAKSVPIVYGNGVIVFNLLNEVTGLKFLLEDKTKKRRELSFFRKELKEHQDNLELYLDSVEFRKKNLSTSLEHHKLVLLAEELRNTLELSTDQIKKIEQERLKQINNLNFLSEGIEKKKDELRALGDASKLMNEQLEKDNKALKESKEQLEKKVLKL